MKMDDSGAFERNQLILGDSLEVLKGIADNSFTAVVTDPPYGLSSQPDMKEVLKHWLAGDDYEHQGSGFMGKDWDSFVPGPKIWEEIMRVLKPGGHILSFSGTRTFDLMVTAMRLAGAEIRDKMDYLCEIQSTVDWVYSQGFPKSLDISKAIDKGGSITSGVLDEFRRLITASRMAKGLTRQQVSEAVVGHPSGACWNWESGLRVPKGENWRTLVSLLELPDDMSALRDAAEREIISSKRVGVKDGAAGGSHEYGMTSTEVDVTAPATDDAKKWEGYGTALKPAHEPVAVFGKSEKGGASEPLAEGLPFCYNAKAGKKERNYGCEDLFWLTTDEGTAKIAKDEYDRLTAENEAGKDTEGFEPHRLAQGNCWPTVKPIELCRYLVKLVKMPGDNLILDPFAGSGTTAIAWVLEGCDFITIDKDPVAFEIAQARINHFKEKRAKR